jgi:hypothetical protein
MAWIVPAPPSGLPTRRAGVTYVGQSLIGWTTDGTDDLFETLWFPIRLV